MESSDSNGRITKVAKYARFSQVNDADEIKKIYGLAIDAVASLVKLLESNNVLDKFVESLFETNVPVELEAFTSLPTISTIKVSLLSLLRNNELPSLADLYYTYRYFKLPFLLFLYFIYIFSFLSQFCSSQERTLRPLFRP